MKYFPFLTLIISACLQAEAHFYHVKTLRAAIDWYVSTPVMLVSTAMFFEHRKGNRVVDVLSVPAWGISLAFNGLMLSFGLVMELDGIPRIVGLIAGSVAFVFSFT